MLPSSRRASLALLAAVGLSGLVLRLWGLGFGEHLPLARPDEEYFLTNALGMFDGDLDPHSFGLGWPEGYSLLTHTLLRIASLWLRTDGQEAHLGCVWILAPGALVFGSRALSAVLGSLTTVPVALLARRLVGPGARGTAAFAAVALLATNYLHGRESHFAVSDATLVFLGAWSTWAAAVAFEEGSLRHGLLAGLLVGLASGVKYSGFFYLPALILAWCGIARAPEATRGLRWAAAAGIVAAVALAFAALNPHGVLHPGTLVDSLLVHHIRYDGVDWGFLGRRPPLGIEFHTTTTLPTALGWPGLALSLLGMIWSLRGRRPAAVTACVSVVSVFVLALGPSRMLFVRYALPTVPLLVAFEAAGLCALVSLLTRWRGRATWALLAALCLAPATRLVEFDQRLARPDTRELARRWLLAAGGGRATVMRAANSIYSAIHALPAEAAAVCAPLVPSRLAAYQPSLAPDADRTRAQALAEWSKLVARGRAGWREVALEATYWTVRPRHPPDYLVDSTPLFECGRRWGEPVAVPGCFQPVARFTPGMSPCSTQFDKFDAFFLPFDRFEGIERMGPEVTIYANRCLATGVSR